MQKKKRKSVKPGEAKKARIIDVKTLTTQEKLEDENPLNFGGLPNRNLKKNLGCG